MGGWPATSWWEALPAGARTPDRHLAPPQQPPTEPHLPACSSPLPPPALPAPATPQGWLHKQSRRGAFQRRWLVLDLNVAQLAYYPRPDGAQARPRRVLQLRGGAVHCPAASSDGGGGGGGALTTFTVQAGGDSLTLRAERATAEQWLELLRAAVAGAVPAELWAKAPAAAAGGSDGEGDSEGDPRSPAARKISTAVYADGPHPAGCAEAVSPPASEAGAEAGEGPRDEAAAAAAHEAALLQELDSYFSKQREDAAGGDGGDGGDGGSSPSAQLEAALLRLVLPAARACAAAARVRLLETGAKLVAQGMLRGDEELYDSLLGVLH